ncbi:hypothetical protein K435DRAFT_799038 [Dendrothele bispora CBS 962.96]|uniref:Uncharacterized protein n=1 Tax=Dendrothele bispora (strain CBS 962.96) TaxID=1314807 RepID=A0A4S8LX58_DENBC|nr:hypothetical protein K435DRAFT_799038 [Dendrothele bispora CBS 962.96]
MGVISASLPGVGTLIGLVTDSIHLNGTAVEGSALALGAQVSSTAPSSTQVNNTDATQTQPQFTTAHATSFATETTNAPRSTATFPPSVPSASSSSVSQADATCTLPENSFSTSISTANTLAANNGRSANNNSVLPFHDITYSKNGTQGTQEVAFITRGGGAGTITDNASFLIVTNLLTLVDRTPTSEGNVPPNDSGDKSTSALPKSTIIGVSAISDIVKMRIGTLPDCYDQNNEGVNLDVASLDKGGGVEASAPRANSRSSQICTGSLSMRANPIVQVPSLTSLPDTCNYNYAIGPNSGYGIDMAAIGATTPAAGVVGIGAARMGSVRTIENVGGNMNSNTNKPNILNNALPPPPMLTLPTPSNIVTSPFDSLEPASAVSVSQTHGLWRFPLNVGMSQYNASSSSFKRLTGWKGRENVCTDPWGILLSVDGDIVTLPNCMMDDSQLRLFYFENKIYILVQPLEKRQLRVKEF